LALTSDIVASISLTEVTVEFPIFDATSRSLRHSLLKRSSGGTIVQGGRARRRVLVRALEKVSLNLVRGDRVALIGSNGSGKTTLLRVLAGVFEPSAGTVSIEGRISPLLSADPGIDPDETGYEYILLHGLLMGMTRREINALVPEIANFTELGDFLAMPVRTYSAGMQVRLAFAMLTATEPDIVLLDEGIGAADAHFSEKARERLQELIGRSSILVLASHQPELLHGACNKALWLDGGRIQQFGPLEQVLDGYARRNEAPV
jgi:ABC-type polysaccharide/polyol phosphate transport system ATPase subunit